METRKTFLVLTLLATLALPAFAKMNYEQNLEYVKEPKPVRLLTETTNEPAWFWMTWFVDGGNISDIPISNTLQGGVFKRHPADEHPYWGLPHRDNGRGDNIEFPAGSEQFYGFAFGLWVGSWYPAEVGGSGGSYRPNVSKGGFYSDLGAMAAPEMENAGGMQDISNRGFYFSDMVIPDGYGFVGQGGNLFAQGGTTPLEYQTLWPFADTAINEKRRAISMPEVDPDNGDIISFQDTYACAGDWIPAQDAAVIWIRSMGPYDIWGQGIRIEQRTYCWNYNYNKDFVYFNYKIQNMNDFTLDSVYISLFMDNDVGTGGNVAGDDGCWDDLIGFDEGLNMGYTYDAGGSESGWVTPAGYIGCVLLETPEDNRGVEIGLTGFETWQNGFDIDNDGTDSLKYSYMASREFVTWENPNDVRMLLNCGPVDSLMPYLETGDQLEITYAIILAYSLDELREKAIAAKIQFENGYFGYSPPPNPALTVIPGDSTVYLNWNSDPENYTDPMSGQNTFEGYRVYRSLSGISETWELMADYDLAGSYNPDTVIVGHFVGPTKSTIEYLGYHSGVDLDKIGYGYNIYTISFDSTIVDSGIGYTVYDLAELKVLNYNENALDEGGFCILTGLDGGVKPLTDPPYIYNSGDIILIDGVQCMIKDGDPAQAEPGDILEPVHGEEFVIMTYPAEALGGQEGIRHFYIDENVHNGQIYYYSVTSYSRPQPTEGVESLEGGKSGKTYWAVPRSNPMRWKTSTCTPARRIAGEGSALVADSVVSPEQITGHTYRVGFKEDPATGTIRLAYVKDMTRDSVVLDDFVMRSGEFSGPVLDGLFIQIAGISIDTLDIEEIIDDYETGWIKKDEQEPTDMDFDVSWEGDDAGEPVPMVQSYLVTIDPNGKDCTDQTCPISVQRVRVDDTLVLIDQNPNKDIVLWLSTRGWPIEDGNKFSIYYPNFAPGNPNLTVFFKDTVTNIQTVNDTTEDTIQLVINPKAGEQFLIKTIGSTTLEDLFEFTTDTSFIDTTDTSITLKDIKVVPNPYYVRAPWDRTQYDRHVVFQYLPEKCKIRIFNTAGLLIRTIEHDGVGLYGGAGSENWDLLTEEGLDCTSGLYIWQVETEDGEKAWGKFAIVR
ncbi:hypothetical protein JXM67_07915 [candidate division WOR-3 bacterium]|nr:hypothetical protein [candidate division WOR-3 bacterium]